MKNYGFKLAAIFLLHKFFRIPQNYLCISQPALGRPTGCELRL